MWPLESTLGGLTGERWLVSLSSLAVLSGLNNGYALKVGSFVQQRVQDAYPPSSPLYLSNPAYAFLGSCLLLGVVISSGLSGLIIRAIGTRNAAMVGELLSFFAFFFGTSASASWMLFVWRITQGLGVGLCITAKPLYLVEAAPSIWRGRLLTVLALFILVGQVIAEGVDWSAADDDTNAWRVDIGVGGTFPFVLFIILYLMPPTAAEEARSRTGCWPLVASSAGEKILSSLNESTPLEATPLQSEASAAAANAGEGEAGKRESEAETESESILGMALPKGTMASLGLSLLLILAKEGTGAGALITYAYSLFLGIQPQSLRDDDASDAAHVDDMIVATFQLLGSLVCFMLVDQPTVGRRPVLLAGCIGSVLGAVLLSVACRSVSAGGLLPYALSTLGFFNQLVQGAFYPLTTELLPVKARLFALGPLYGLAQLVAFGITELFPFANTTVLFATLAGIAAVNAAALWVLVPETIPREELPSTTTTTASKAFEGGSQP